MAVRKREYRRVQQDWYLARPSSRLGVVPSTPTERVSTNARGFGFQVMGNLRTGTRLPHLYVAQPSRGFRHSHFLVMDWIPYPGSCTAFTRVFNYNCPVSRFGHPGAIAFGLGWNSSSPCVVCLRGGQRIRHVSPP